MDGVETHNLKKIDVRIPHRALTVISGVSGSGKSSLAFDTLYAEGQRRFVESLSTYARQFLQRMEKPPLTRVHNILPAVALRQKNSITHARSTVSTLTELSDHIQLIYTHIGVTRCPGCGEIVQRDTPTSVLKVLAQQDGRRLIFIADVHVLSVQTPQKVLEDLAAEGHQRIYLDGKAVNIADVDVERLLELKSFPVVIDRVKTGPDGRSRLQEAIENTFALGGGRLRVLDVTEKGAEPTERIFKTAFACNSCDKIFIPPQPALFSFNSPIGACPECSGFGKTSATDPRKVIPNPDLSLEQGAVVVFETDSRRSYRSKLLKYARDASVPTDVPFGQLRPEDKDFILHGKGRFKGVMGFFDRLKEKRHKPQNRILLARFRGYTTCHVCDGQRFSPEAMCVTVAGHTIADFYGMRIREARVAFDDLQLTEAEAERVEPLLEEVKARLSYLDHVGLGYLHLSRQSRTLSGGEVQRIQLTSSLGRTLTDTLYVLDEPTAGLHARDTLRLLEVLQRLRDIGNTVVVVEHDPDMIKGADWAVELGPLGGEHGGKLLYQGPTKGLMGLDTPTGRSLEDRTPGQRSLLGALAFDPQRDPYVAVLGAAQNNLQGINVRFPLHRLTCVTGVSGSGKTSLVHKCLFDAWRRMKGHSGVEEPYIKALEGFDDLRDVVMMRQGGLGRSSRSTIASYSKAWDAIRKIFGGLPDAKEHGLGPGSFSFNRPGGRCEKCEGTGRLVIEMHFMADIEIVCDECDGKRFMKHVLDVRQRGKNINDVLRMTVREAHKFFASSRAVTNRLQALLDVGLGYLRLGQTTSTLSGGEAQRLLLASFLGQKAGKSAGMLFIFDEPTIGLHLKDIEVLLGAMRRTIEEGHTVIVVEHNTDFIAQADHIIDLGPDGGDGGGQVVIEGTPAQVAACPGSWTGLHLRELLEKQR